MYGGVLKFVKTIYIVIGKIRLYGGLSMRVVRPMILTIFIILVANTIMLFSYAQEIDAPQVNEGTLASAELQEERSPDNKDVQNGTEKRNNFDIASLLSLLGIGLLKFVDDKLKVKLKDKFKIYKRCLIVTTVIFVLLEFAIVVFYIGNWGPVSFGNLKNIVLGSIPIVFCILTLTTEKNDSNTIILSQTELDIRINDFTSSGMSPLGMIVGDMDFFGKVYSKEQSRKRPPRDDITTNSQIKALMENNIDCIRVVCKIPNTGESKRRIGYLLEKFEGRFHIQFFDEDFPIPKMRGRIMYKQNQQVVVITKKITKPSKYEYSEYEVSSLPGALFADLWNTVWHCSSEFPEIIDTCKREYNNYISDQLEVVQ